MLNVALHLTLIIWFMVATSLIFSLEESPIFVVTSGTEPLHEDATSIKFFILAENRGKHSAIVGLEMKKCCQYITSNDTDCDSMTLHNGLREELHPGDKINLTMFFTNRYLHGRKGDCWLRLKSKEESKGISTLEVQIHFDTSTFLLTPLQKVMSFLPGSNLSSECESVDEDPGRGCLPVNCLLKYSGFRSYFNRTWRRCQSTRSCQFQTPIGKKSETILSPSSNKCKHVKGMAKFPEKMEEAQDLVEVNVLSYTKYPIKVKCVHGHRNDSGELCICEPGWTSQDFSPKNFNPEIGIYVKCDQPISRNKPIPSTSLIILLGMLVILALVICFYVPWACRRYAAQRKIETISSELAGTPSSSDSEDSATPSVKSSRRGVSPSAVSTKGKMEFSPLVQAERSTRPVVSEWKVSQSVGQKRLSYPESFQLKPLQKLSEPSRSPSSSNSLSVSSSASSQHIPVKERWSIPETSDSTSCHCIYPRQGPLTQSTSAEALIRQVDSCSCCQDDPRPLVSVRVHTTDPNRNTLVTLKKISTSDSLFAFDDGHFPGLPPQCITETATKKWKNELDTFLKTLRPEASLSSPPKKASSNFTTLSEFWKEDESPERETTPRTSKRVRPLWFQQLLDSIKSPK